MGALSAAGRTGRFLPDKAIDLVDQAAARVKISITARPAAVQELRPRCGNSSANRITPRHATMAVLPTPGSPMRTGLFFLRRARTSIVVSISAARPITGSSLPSRASFVRSREYCRALGPGSSDLIECRWSEKVLPEEIIEEAAATSKQILERRSGPLLAGQAPIVHLAQIEGFCVALAGFLLERVQSRVARRKHRTPSP